MLFHSWSAIDGSEPITFARGPETEAHFRGPTKGHRQRDQRDLVGTIRLCFIDRRRRIIRPDEFDYGFWRCRGDGWRGNKHCRSFNNSQWVSSEGHRCYSASQGFHFARGIRKSTAPHQRIDFTDRSIDRSLILCWFDLSGIDVLAWCEEV